MSFKYFRSFQITAPKSNWRRSAQTGILFLGLIATTTSPLWLNNSTTAAELNIVQSSDRSPSLLDIKVLFVNSIVGNDASGDGTEKSPLKSVTQALRLAQPNTVIMLAPGTYSAETGEKFPLILKPNVTLQGNIETRGQNIILKGGGLFLSATAAGQNVTLVGADQASITGITITNPNQRGSGLWIESTNPIVTENTFTGNQRDGISINGNSTSVIRNNKFYKNSGNGITIYGKSQPEIRDNSFSNTGFAISVLQNAAPKLIGNQISRNTSGIVVEGNAQPVLRNNTVTDNEQDGLVAIAQSRPDLGIIGDPGGNIFRGNRQLEIRNKTNNQIIPAFGNEITQKIQGQIDLAGGVQTTNAASLLKTPIVTQQEPIIFKTNPVTANSSLLELSQAVLTSPLQSSAASSISAASFPIPSGLQEKPPTSIVTATRPLVVGNDIKEVAKNDIQSETANSMVLTPPVAAISTPAPQINQVVIPIIAPQPPTAKVNPATAGGNSSVLPQTKPATLITNTNRNSRPQIPVFNPSPIVRQNQNNQQLELLPVPTEAIPVGNIGSATKVAPNQAVGGNTQSSTSSATTASLRYRVVVEADSNTQEDLVRSLVPDAFNTVANGRKVLQVGAYSDRAYAQGIVDMLNSKGLKGNIQPIK